MFTRWLKRKEDSANEDQIRKSMEIKLAQYRDNPKDDGTASYSLGPGETIEVEYLTVDMTEKDRKDAWDFIASGRESSMRKKGNAS